MSRKNVDNALMDTLNPILPGKVFPNVYVGEAVEYIVTNYTTVPSVYGEGGPAAARCLVMVHYYLPTGQNPNAKKLAIEQALFAEGFTFPSIVPAHESQGQHWVFECEYVNAGGVYGQV